MEATGKRQSATRPADGANSPYAHNPMIHPFDLTTYNSLIKLANMEVCTKAEQRETRGSKLTFYQRPEQILKLEANLTPSSPT